MKNTIAVLILLTLSLASLRGEARAEASSPVIASDAGARQSVNYPIFGSRTYNRSKNLRQNSVKRTNRRHRRALKKWGLAMEIQTIGKEVSNG